MENLFRKSVVTISTREWRLHGTLLALTVVTTTLAGVMLAATDFAPREPPLSGLLDYLLYLPLTYFYFVVDLVRYAPNVPAKKIGAFIKIRSPIPSRRALFDIGLAGPLAGFVVALPLAVVGILTVGPPLEPQEHAIFFNDPVLFRLLAQLFGVTLDPNSPINPYYMASWIGLLVTSLNLMPVGQLDGGHGTFAVFGRQAHALIGRLAFVTMAVLAVLGYMWHGSPSGFLYVVLLGVMLRVPHPEPYRMEPLGQARTLVAVLTLLVFILCFWPFPITIT